jgi:multiple sugar transport system permease protein
MTVWLMMAFFKEVPREIEEAAQMDGCRRIQAFVYVVLPLVVPGVIASGVLAFIFSWNEFAIALNLTSRATATVPVGVARFAQDYEISMPRWRRPPLSPPSRRSSSCSSASDSLYAA